MSAALRERSAQARTANGGVPARRAVIRWAWRLFRREWRQQLLVLSMLTVAVAASVLGVAIATSAPPSPNAATFGIANHVVTLPGSDHHLAADIAAIRQHFRIVDVIENEQIATGSVQTVQLRAQDPYGRYGRPMLSLVSGRYPTGPGEVAVTSQVATLFDLHTGGRWQQGGLSRRVVGVVENPSNLLDEFALVAPGQVSTPSQVSILFDATRVSEAGFRFPGGVTPQTPPPASAGLSPAIVVLGVATFGLIFICLVAVAGFTVMAQRRLRAFGMLTALGATDRNVRLVMLANGAVVGIVATLIGAAVGFAGWFAYAPRLQASTAHRIDPFHLPWWAIGTAMALAIATAVVAARRPARSVTRMPAVAALSGRPVRPKAAHRSGLPGIVLLAVGLVLLAFAGGWRGATAGDQLKLLTGLVATTAGSLLLASVCISMLARAGRHAPIAVRLVLRDLDRYRARSAAALAAVTFAVFIAVLTCILATARFADPLDYFGPNLPASQLIVYTPYGSFGAGHGGPLTGPPVPPTQGELRNLQPHVNAIATSLRAHDVLALFSAVNPTAQGAGAVLEQLAANGPNRWTQGASQFYVATPALLRHYGIRQSDIDPTADILTSRAGLAGVRGLQIYYGPQGPGQRGICPAGSCVENPRTQTLGQLPTDVSDPNLLLTEHAMRTLGLRQAANGWLIQAAGPLTPAQINAARQMAAAADATIEVKNQNPPLSELRNWSTAAGILIALGVLAMTTGLIRSETAGEVRTLTATGASGRTRRTLTGATAGALGLLGALLGTAVAYLAAIAWYRSSLSTTVRHVPVDDLIVILAGLPLAATIGGWLLAGREPPAIARQPIE
jgi:putative ABC transport system permease protein